jgi:hypothetical protein
VGEDGIKGRKDVPLMYDVYQQRITRKEEESKRV